AATGQLPFIAESLFEILRLHLEQPPRPPRQLRPDMPAAYEEAILTALAKDPAQRFPDAPTMASAFMHAAQGLPGEAWISLRMTQGVAVPGLPSGGAITPYGPRLPS